MKILYAIQGTGNGHISRARDVVPALRQRAEVDVLVSGTEAEIDFPFPVRYRLKGLGFVFGKKGGIDIMDTFLKMDTGGLLKDIARIDIDKYDLVINDFEPVTAWACRERGLPYIALSHQCAVLSKKAPRPLKKDPFGRAVLKYYAPSTARYGFHFSAFDRNIFTPVIRREIREKDPSDEGHYTVYLPAYGETRLLKNLGCFPDVRWEVFSKHHKETLTVENMTIRPVDNGAFIDSMARSTGVLCGAGFETPAEALFLKKKLLVIPMKAQYEQQCNAAALQSMGVPVIRSLKRKHHAVIRRWLDTADVVPVDYPDITADIIDRILAKHGHPEPAAPFAEMP